MVAKYSKSALNDIINGRSSQVGPFAGLDHVDTRFLPCFFALYRALSAALITSPVVL